MKTLQEKIAVMQAALEGKRIGESWSNIPLHQEGITWNWDLYDYCILPDPPAPKVVPWTLEEIIALMPIKVRRLSDNDVGLVDGARPVFKTVKVLDDWMKPQRLFEDFVLLDGSPCGRLEGQ